MKKNISINIFGTIYAIDEDAYQLLENYLQSMKNYFSSQEGGDEIADDIEHRVAELLWEYKNRGMEAVNIETVKEIINKVGNPSDIDDGGASVHNDSTVGEEEAEVNDGRETMTFFDRVKHHVRTHHLYRNTKDKVLGGVCSGMAEYFGAGDVVFWRAGFIVLAFLLSKVTIWWLPDFFNGIVPVMYIILWIVVPEAKTPEDKLRMKGRKVNPETLKQQVVSDSEEQQEKSRNTPTTRNSGCIRFVFAVLLVLLLFPLFFMFVALLFGIVILFSVALGLSSFVFSLIPEMQWIPDLFDLCTPLLWVALLSAFVVVAMPIYCIIRFLRNNSRPLSVASVFTLIATWILSLAAFIFTVVMISIQVHNSTLLTAA